MNNQQSAVNNERLLSDRNYYKRKLKSAIQLLENREADVLDILRDLDIEFKEYEYIMYDV